MAIRSPQHVANALGLFLEEPRDFATICEIMAEIAYDSGSELASAWQDRSLLTRYNRIGRLLETCARSIKRRG